MSAAYGVWKDDFSGFSDFLEHCDQDKFGKIICVELSINYDMRMIFGSIQRDPSFVLKTTGDALIVIFSDPLIHLGSKLLELKQLLTESGFETKEVEYFDGTQFCYELDKNWEPYSW